MLKPEVLQISRRANANWDDAGGQDQPGRILQE
jgi:hypothetical protein